MIPNNINVSATMAANSEESSYACYLDNKRDTYLGDSYSVHWMDDSVQEVLTTETLQKQFKIIKKKTECHMQEFGDMSIAQLHVSEFQGRKKSKPVFVSKMEKDSVQSRDVHIEIVKRKLMKSNSEEREKQSVLTKKLN
ncbi:legumain [Trichonephila clavipes]|nr:legumain [Trichonephila clavipes]